VDDWAALSTDLARQLSEALLLRKWLLATAESCTGGMVSATLTDIAGSSAWFDCGFVTYSNQAKMNLLGVSEKTLQRYGAVSEETAKEMAQGALKNSQANISVSITGIAGPSGGSPEKPVGTVCFAFSTSNQTFQQTQFYNGNRQDIRAQAVIFALSELVNVLNQTYQSRPE